MVASRNFLASLLLHAVLSVIIVFWTPMMNESRLTDQNLPIEIITIDQFTKLVEQTTMPDKPAEKAASQPTAHEYSGAPEAANQSAMPLRDATAKQQPSDADNEATVETPRYRVAQPAPLARPTVKPKPLLDIGRVQALLNKTPDQKTADSGAHANDIN